MPLPVTLPDLITVLLCDDVQARYNDVAVLSVRLSVCHTICLYLSIRSKWKTCHHTSSLPISRW